METKKEWHELSEEERIKSVYSKYTIADFLAWWQNGSENIMEIRIRDFNTIKEIASELNLPYSASGVYINNPIELKNVIRIARKKEIVMWFSCNSRKKNFNQWGKKSFGGSTENVYSIDYFSVDIDRINKLSSATNEELKKCNELADKIIERMATQKWDEHYIKICSGNGVQLLFGLDVPIKMPEKGFDLKTRTYQDSEEFEALKAIMRSVGKDIKLFSDRFKEKLNCEVDISCFKLAGVLSLPFTKNYKYGGSTWRGIVEMKTGTNVGLTDYILSRMKSVKEYNAKAVFVNRGRTTDKDKLTPEEIINHPLTRFMLDNDLPRGKINNVLWMSLKCLIRDAKLKFDDENLRKMHKDIEHKYKDVFPTNFPNKTFTFQEKTINRYCADNLIPPLFPLKEIYKTKEPYDLNLSWKMLFTVKGEKLVFDGKDMFEDMYKLKQVLASSDKSENVLVYMFTNGCKEKYGEATAKYFFENWFSVYFGWRA